MKNEWNNFGFVLETLSAPYGGYDGKSIMAQKLLIGQSEVF